MLDKCLPNKNVFYLHKYFYFNKFYIEEQETNESQERIVTRLIATDIVYREVSNVRMFVGI